MRWLEIMLCVSLGILLVGVVWPVSPRPKFFTYLTFLALSIFVAHLLWERGRWQLLPAYCLLLSLVLLEIPWLKPEPAPPAEANPTGRALLLRLGEGLLTGLLLHLAWLSLLVAVALSLILPVFELPQPSGDNLIGTQALYFIDPNRPEKFTADLADHRELMVRVWYPAHETRGISPLPFLENVAQIAPPTLSRLKVPIFTLDHLALVKSHSYPNAFGVADQTFPVLVFSHGYGLGYEGSNFTQMEELASHGYVIFSLNHTYESFGALFPDGRVIPEDQYVFDNMNNRVPRTLNLDDQFSTWVADTTFILNELRALQSGTRESAVTGMLNLDKIGVFGTSFGGATAVEICLFDTRCKAGANLDGGAFGYTDYERYHLQKPFMFLRNQSWANYRDYLYSWGDDYTYQVVIHNSTHGNFGDLSLISPLAQYGKLINPNVYLGSIDQRRMIQIVNAYLLAFFDRHLKGQTAPLLHGPSADFPDVDYWFHTP